MAKKKLSKSVLAAMSALKKRYGEDDIVTHSSSSITAETLSTGRPDFDIELNGGYAKGKIIEFWGEEQVGKTKLALECVKKVQENGGTVAYIDMEHALNEMYCEESGVDYSEMINTQPEYGEQAFMIMRTLLATGEIDLIVVDSVAAMIPKSELEGETGESKMGLHARTMSQGLKQLNSSLKGKKTVILFINQLRDTFAMHGAKKKPTGGNSLKYYASQRFEIKSKGRITSGTDVIGFKQYIRILKNKIGVPFKELEWEIIYGKGVDDLNSTIDALVMAEIFTKSGSWFCYNGEKLANGAKKIRLLLEENTELLNELKNELDESRNK